MERELWRWDAVELAAAIRTRTISSREAVASVLARLDAVNPALNAVTVLLADQALGAADRADAAVRRGEPLGPLHGVPVTIKQNVDQRSDMSGKFTFSPHPDRAWLASPHFFRRSNLAPNVLILSAPELRQ